MGPLGHQLLNTAAPSTLYHYTTQAGLIGILEKKVLWASKMQYLNDSSEFRHALSITKTVIETRKQQIKSDDERILITKIETVLRLLPTAHLFVGSLSAEGDLLSQWRGYCPDSNGFSIGFNVDQLRKALSQQGFSLAPCIYKQTEQFHLIDELFADVLNIPNTLNEDIFSPQRNPGFANLSKQLGPQASIFMRDLLTLGSLLKHCSFTEEREWRIVCGVIPHIHPEFRIRPGKSMLIPYREIQLCGNDQPVSIDEIIVGPTPHPDLATQSADHLAQSLKSKGIQVKSVRPSRIPYRAW